MKYIIDEGCLFDDKYFIIFIFLTGYSITLFLNP